MVDATKIAVEPREQAGKGAARATRRAGRLPGIIYGDGKPPMLVAMDPAHLIRELNRPGFFTRVFDVEIGKESQRALARDVQFHPVNDKPEHIDFMRVNESTRVRVHVPVKFEHQDRSPGLKRGGVLNVVRHTIELWCMVQNIPRHLSVDLEGLDIGDSVHISSIKLPEGVKPTISRDFTIAAVAAPSVFKTAEEEAAEATAKAAAEAAVAGVEGAPVEGAPAGAPGAAAPGGGATGGGAQAGDKKGGAPAAAEKKGGKK